MRERSDLMDVVKFKAAGAGCGCDDGLAAAVCCPESRCNCWQFGKESIHSFCCARWWKTEFAKGQFSLVEIGFGEVGEKKKCPLQMEHQVMRETG